MYLLARSVRSTLLCTPSSSCAAPPKSEAGRPDATRMCGPCSREIFGTPNALTAAHTPSPPSHSRQTGWASPARCECAPPHVGRVGPTPNEWSDSSTQQSVNARLRGWKKMTRWPVFVRSGSARKQLSMQDWSCLLGKIWPTTRHPVRRRSQPTRGVACPERQHQCTLVFPIQTAGFRTVCCTPNVDGNPAGCPTLPYLFLCRRLHLPLLCP